MSALDLPVTKLTGIGKVKAEAFGKLSIRTVGDLLLHFPSRYENRGLITPLRDGSLTMAQSYVLTVATPPRSARIGGRMTITKFRAFDDSGTIEVTYFNQPYVADRIHVGETFRFYGRLTEKKGKYSLPSPTAEPVLPDRPLPALYAVYPLAAGLNNNTMRACVAQALDLAHAALGEILPEDIRRAYSLATYAYAIENIHRPPDTAALDRAARRLAFDEMLESALAARLMRAKQTRVTAQRMADTDVSPLTAALPFALTGAQKRTVDEICADLARGKSADAPRMARIIVGDVGSGKTACALAAIYIALKNGCQAVLMAPTEILAAQHFADIEPTLARFGYTTEKLTGSTGAAEKRRIKAAVAAGDCDLVIGTHALIEDDVTFARAGLVVCDEQHRFGIAQRAKLLAACPRAHMLVMSATPIPRTLSLVLMGDLDVSRLDEMPPGRQKVDTFFVDSGYRARLNNFIEKQVAAGGQVYVVCPAIEPADDDADDCLTVSAFGAAREDTPPLRSATEVADALRARFPQFAVELVHGKLRPAQKNDIMTRFAAGEIQILVSTTVIEVGINVPNASLMIVENAERFGLSQLHQLRGRVGRGTRKSYCVLVSDAKGENAERRLRLMTKTNDGFVIADEDLRMRGPGDFLGTDGARQSGEGRYFRMAAMCNDPRLFENATHAAETLLAADPQLAGERLAPLRARLDAVLHYGGDTMN